MYTSSARFNQCLPRAQTLSATHGASKAQGLPSTRGTSVSGPRGPPTRHRARPVVRTSELAVAHDKYDARLGRAALPLAARRER